MENEIKMFGSEISESQMRKALSDSTGRIVSTKVFETYGGELALKSMQRAYALLDSSDPEERREARELLKLFKDKIYKSVTPEKSKETQDGSVSDGFYEKFEQLMNVYNKKNNIRLSDVDIEDAKDHED